MKRLLCYLFLLITVNQIVDAQVKPTSKIDIWKITKDIENDMKERLNSCGVGKKCKGEGIIKDSNKVVYQAIIDSFPATEYTITWLIRRYRNKDEERYRTIRNITDEKKYDVNGYLTWIIKVKSKLNKEEDPKYYDIVTVCPPPDPPCD
jgi:hypothetical protein